MLLFYKTIEIHYNKLLVEGRQEAKWSKSRLLSPIIPKTQKKEWTTKTAVPSFQYLLHFTHTFPSKHQKVWTTDSQLFCAEILIMQFQSLCWIFVLKIWQLCLNCWVTDMQSKIFKSNFILCQLMLTRFVILRSSNQMCFKLHSELDEINYEVCVRRRTSRNSM